MACSTYTDRIFIGQNPLFVFLVRVKGRVQALALACQLKVLGVEIRSSRCPSLAGERTAWRVIHFTHSTDTSDAWRVFCAVPLVFDGVLSLLAASQRLLDAHLIKLSFLRWRRNARSPSLHIHAVPEESPCQYSSDNNGEHS